MRPDNIITMSIAIGVGVAAIYVSRNVLADLWRAMFPRRNRRRPGHDERIQAMVNMRAREIISASRRRGWETRRRRMDEARRDAIGRDIRAVMAADVDSIIGREGGGR